MPRHVLRRQTWSQGPPCPEPLESRLLLRQAARLQEEPRERLEPRTKTVIKAIFQETKPPTQENREAGMPASWYASALCLPSRCTCTRLGHLEGTGWQPFLRTLCDVKALPTPVNHLLTHTHTPPIIKRCMHTCTHTHVHFKKVKTKSGRASLGRTNVATRLPTAPFTSQSLRVASALKLGGGCPGPHLLVLPGPHPGLPPSRGPHVPTHTPPATPALGCPNTALARPPAHSPGVSHSYQGGARVHCCFILAGAWSSSRNGAQQGHPKMKIR